MKLLCEVNDEINYISEGAEGEKKKYFIEGVFMQGDIKNRNGRVYPSTVLENEVNRYVTQFVEQKRAFGELGHPAGPTINLDRASHMITELKRDGSNFVGKAKIIDTPMGNIVKSLMDEGAKLGVSSRGVGTLKSNNQGIMEVQGDFILATAGDIVADPSAPDAFVAGVMENVDWVLDSASGNWIAERVIEQTKETGRQSRRDLEEQKLELFTKFVNSLK